MVPISPDASPSAEGSIDSLGEPDDGALEPSRERRSRVGLDDEVKVVGLDGEVEDADSASRALCQAAAERRDRLITA